MNLKVSLEMSREIGSGVSNVSVEYFLTKLHIHFSSHSLLVLWVLLYFVLVLRHGRSSDG